MKNKTFKVIRNNIIGSVILTFLLHITGVLPYLIELVVSMFHGDSGTAISYAAGVPGLVIGFMVSLLSLLIGLSPIVIIVAITYFVVKNRTTDEM